MEKILEILRKIHKLARDSGIEHEAVSDIETLAKEGLQHAEAAIGSQVGK